MVKLCEKCGLDVKKMLKFEIPALVPDGAVQRLFVLIKNEKGSNYVKQLGER